jgi:hypothetical protein
MTSAPTASPIAAAVSGSPADLSRTFHATWSTAEPATMTMTSGSTAAV